VLWRLDHGKRRFRVRPARFGDDLPGFTPESIPCVTVIDLKQCRAVTICLDCKQNVTPNYWENTDRWAEQAWSHCVAWWAHLTGLRVGGFHV
jgi:hypothetical protein